MGDKEGSITIYQVPRGLLVPTLQALLPLRQVFQVVKSLTLFVAEILDDVSITLLSSLFGSSASFKLVATAPRVPHGESCMKLFGEMGRFEKPEPACCFSAL